MKIKKNFLILSPVVLMPIFGVVSCSNTKNNEYEKNFNNLKENLNNFLNKNAVGNNDFGPSQIRLNSRYLDIDKAKNLNLFLVLENYGILNEVFGFDSKYLTYGDENRYSIQYSFSDVIDSFGNQLRPFVNDIQKTIVIPVLVTMVDNLTGFSASKFINFFTLNIVDQIVQSSIDEEKPYEGSNGVALSFNGTIFKTIPKIMIDKYFSLHLYSRSDKFKQKVRYDVNQIDKFKNKTLTEVRSISGAISNPLNQKYGNNDFSYSITSSNFWQDDFAYARYFISVKLLAQGDSKILDDAEKIYKLSYSKEYTYVDKSWKFAYPSNSDIDNFVSNNQKIASELVENAQNSPILFSPTVNLSYIDAASIGVSGIVKRFKNANDFLAPNKFKHVVLDDDYRVISFDILSLETDENDENVVKININLNVGEGKLKSSKEFSKRFDIKSWKFV